MQHRGTDAVSSGPHWGEREQTASAPVLLMIGTTLSQNLGILVSESNPTSHVRVDGNGNMSAVLTG